MALGTQQLPFQNQQQHHQMLAAQQRLYQQRAIAPAPTSSSSSASRLYMPYAKPPGYINTSGTTLDSNNPSVVRRNARERNRVKQVNNGFVNLRQHLPQAIVADLSNGRRGGTGPSASKKLSKVDTLRMAVEYIRRLKRVIDEVDQSDTDSSSVSSYSSCSSGSLSSSPTPLTNSSSLSVENFDAVYQQHKQQQQQAYLALSYAGSFQSQQQEMTSPTGSTSSSTYSDPCSANSTNSASYYNNHNQLILPQSTPLKFEPPAYEEYPNTSTEDEELLDYISLWQEDM